MVESILSQLAESVRIGKIEACGNGGGFSGAQFWKVDSSRGELCVRRWPRSHPSIAKLRWVHSILVGVQKKGCDFVPAPLRKRDGETVFREGGFLWEVTPWLPGRADLRLAFTEDKLVAACRSLAQFHLATESLVSKEPEAVSPGMQARYEAAVGSSDKWNECWNAAQQMPRGETAALCLEVLELVRSQLVALPSKLEPIWRQRLRLQPCIRDIWHQHVLFESEQLTGIVDFGAMAIESPALDLGRLLGSLEAHQNDVWRMGISAYKTVRSLSVDELDVMHAAARVAPSLSALNWICWLAIEQRVFEKMDLVHERLRDLYAQLQLSPR